MQYVHTFTVTLTCCLFLGCVVVAHVPDFELFHRRENKTSFRRDTKLQEFSFCMKTEQYEIVQLGEKTHLLLHTSIVSGFMSLSCQGYRCVDGAILLYCLILSRMTLHLLTVVSSVYLSIILGLMVFIREIFAQMERMK